ncbi:hypothetical protein [Phenylobacterium sp.]|jgi:hypothetical protein|uniref:hypothetical protein n=1 Tax=Phenylobacterium sp. TaxID=1871053 RepID=UPI002F947777
MNGLAFGRQGRHALSAACIVAALPLLACEKRRRWPPRRPQPVSPPTLQSLKRMIFDDAQQLSLYANKLALQQIGWRPEARQPSRLQCSMLSML